MPVKSSDSLIRHFTLPVFVDEGPGKEPRPETLTIRYRPVSDEWLDKWAEITARERQELVSEIESLSKEAEAARERGETFDVDAAQKRLEEKRQKNTLVRQLAEILVSVDYLDEQGNQIPPTAEFLYTLDRALLIEIQETIEKKLFPEKMRNKL